MLQHGNRPQQSMGNACSGERYITSESQKTSLNTGLRLQAHESAAMVPHVLVFPFPAQGHLTSMLKLADLLSMHAIRVSFLNSDYNHRRLSLFSGAYSRLSHHPNFRFISIPDGLPDNKPRSASRFIEMERALRTRCKSVFLERLADGEWPKVTCLIVDGVMTWAIDAAEEVGVPAVAFRTSSSCSYWAYFSIPRMVELGVIPISEDADLDEPVLGVPGLESFIRRRDLPGICRTARDVSDEALQFVSTVTNNTNHARALIFNTLEFLEAPILAHVRSQCPITYSIGPLHSLLRTMTSSSESSTSSISASLWQEDRSCITWLNSQPDRSVIYISFGSFTVVSPEQMNEFWHGLVNSGCRFLWVVRPGSINGSEERMPAPPEELEAAAKERGRLVEWAPQVEVLAHPAVGCFLTHSGWNSTLESIMAGVPMICWPFFMDQLINSRYVEQVWKIGLDMKDQCKREVVERMVRTSMEGESAEELRQSAVKTAEMARRCVEEGGSSYEGFLRLVEHIKFLSSEAGK